VGAGWIEPSAMPAQGEADDAATSGSTVVLKPENVKIILQDGLHGAVKAQGSVA